jgi:DNA polymerase-3 subunit gamma/tau
VPCGKCSACTEIDEGRFVDLIEVDAASKTKVDDTRDLLDNVQYAPARGRFKVYLIDEVHMLSKSSFNALLKTLEEPPEHVKFLLATTDPQKLPVTVLSRCLQFNLTRLTPRQIQDRLAHICDEESIEFEAAALALLARAADGSLRDALSLLDQAIAYCGGNVAAVAVSSMLGTIDKNYVSRLLQQLAENDAAGVLATVAEIDEQFPDYARLLEDLARSLQQLAVFQVVGAVETEDEIADAELARLAAALPAEDVQLFYQIAVLGRRDLHLAPDPRSGAQMVLLRMLAFRPASAATGGGQVSGPAVKGGSAGVADAAPSKVVGAQPVSRAESTARAEPVKQAAPAAAVWQEPNWSVLVEDMALPGAVRLLAGNCSYLKRSDNTIFLSIDPRSESLLTRPRKEALANALSDRFGEPLVVDIAMGAAADETPLQEKSRLADEKIEAAIATLESDPNVQTLQDMFGAELKKDSVEILDGTSQD